MISTFRLRFSQEWGGSFRHFVVFSSRDCISMFIFGSAGLRKSLGGPSRCQFLELLDSDSYFEVHFNVSFGNCWTERVISISISMLILGAQKVISRCIWMFVLGTVGLSGGGGGGGGGGFAKA